MKTKTFLAMLAAVSLFAAPAGAQVTVDSVITNDLFEPYGVAVDAANNFYIADSANNRIVRLDANTGVLSTLAGILGEAGSQDGYPYEALFSSPQGLALATIGSTNGLIVADTGNHLIRFVNLANGLVSTLAGIAGSTGANDGAGATATFTSPTGLGSDGSNIVYIADLGNNLVRRLDLATMNVTTVPNTSFFQPAAVAVKSANELWVADTRHHTVNLIDPLTGNLITVLGTNGIIGTADSSKGTSARFNGPRGLLWLGSAGLLIADTANHSIRLATNYTAFGANNYAVKTFAGIPGQPGLTNGPALESKLNAPIGLAFDEVGNGFLIADMANSALRRIQNGPVQPPVANPQIGWVDFTVPPAEVVSILRTDQPFVFNNDQIIAILAEAGTETYFTYGPTPSNPLEDTVPNPTRLNGNTPPAYRNGMYPNQVPPSMVAPQPDLTVKAVGVQDGRRNSSVIQARFQFRVGNPTIQGENAASFTITDVTAGAAMYYTTDGVTDPAPDGTNSIGPIFSPAGLSLDGSGNITFKIRAFRNNYQPSSVVTKVFATTNFVPNRITFGLTNGEPSSAFLARPGQFFYAPVTLQLQPEGETMYSLQFNVAVANRSNSPAIANAAGIDFASMLVSDVPKEKTPDHNPPPSFRWFLTIPPFLMDGITNRVGYSLFTNGNNNLLGVGWMFRPAFEYIVRTTNWDYLLDFDTTKHDLIKYSIAHDTLFEKVNGAVVVGAYSFQVPTNAANGDQYFIQLGSPSATRDGVGAPGANVYIRTPPASQAVTVNNNIPYLVGDVAPFRWLNAGDFGEGRLDNADVMQVFQSAILGLHTPPRNSDLFWAMDSAGTIGISNNGTGYYTSSSNYYSASPVTKEVTFNNVTYTFDYNTLTDTTTTTKSTDETFTYSIVIDTPTTNITVRTTNNYFWSTNGFVYDTYVGYSSEQMTLVHDGLFNGSDTNINDLAFGDGVLDVNDVFVTFRRSLDPSLVWFNRLWTNGQFVAVPTNNLAFNSNTPALKVAAASKAVARQSASTGQQPSISFTAGDAVVSAGQTVPIPITAQIQGDYPLRVLGLSITVQPLDDSAGVVQAIQFTPVAELGSPTLSGSRHAGNYSATWLDSSISGLSGSNVLIGTLTFTAPAGAPANAAYAIHFDHVSASPNGIALFPKRARLGLITLSDRSASTWGDGIPDSWRLRYFGSINNLLSAASADADGDAASNLHECKAGTDPNDSSSRLKLNSRKSGTAPECVVRWPSVAGKRYVIEAATALFGPSWIPLSTNIGTGADMEYADLTGGSPRFYRVRVQD